MLFADLKEGDLVALQYVGPYNGKTNLMQQKVVRVTRTTFSVCGLQFRKDDGSVWRRTSDRNRIRAFPMDHPTIQQSLAEQALAARLANANLALIRATPDVQEQVFALLNV